MANESDTVEQVVARLQAEGPTSSVRRRAGGLLAELEPVVRAEVRRHTRSLSPSAGDELVQDVLALIWAKLPGFRGTRHQLRPWARAIARHVSANARRRKRDALTEDGVILDADPGAGALIALLRSEQRDVLIAAIAASLDPLEQDVLYHRYVHGLDREVIARDLGLGDANAVRVILQRGQRRLRAALQERLGQLGHGASFIHVLDG